MCSSSSERTPKLQLTTEQPLAGEYGIPLTKDTLHTRPKEKPQQDDRRGKIVFRSKFHIHNITSVYIHISITALNIIYSVIIILI